MKSSQGSLKKSSKISPNKSQSKILSSPQKSAKSLPKDDRSKNMATTKTSSITQTSSQKNMHLGQSKKGDLKVYDEVEENEEE